MTSESKSTPAVGRGRRGRPPNRRGGKKGEDALQIEIDIEEESQKRVMLEREQIDMARKKHPFLFKIYEERNALKFKSAQWVKQQALKKANSKVQIFKNLKQILTNFDSR